MLRVSIDEREDADVEATFADMPFVIQEDLLEQYGDVFFVALDEHQMFTVEAAQ